MTLDELTRDANAGCIYNPETIRAVLTAFSDMPGKELFSKVQANFDPFEDLLRSTGLSGRSDVSVTDVFVEIHMDIFGASHKGHIAYPVVYESSTRALSLLAQLPRLHMPLIRKTKGGSV